MQKPEETINFIYLDEIKGIDDNMKKWLKEQYEIDRKHLEDEQ